MKKSIVLIVLVLGMVIPTMGQSVSRENDNRYVVSTTKISQLDPIIKAAKALKTEDQDNYGDFQIILYGPNLAGLTDRDLTDPYVTKARAAGAELLVCKLSLEKFDVNPEVLHPGIKVVTHAFTHLLQLQQKHNYYSIQL